MEEKKTSLEQELLILTTTTFERLLALSTDAILLYMFYYNTMKRQSSRREYENLSIKATTSYCSVGLKMSERRIRQAKKILVDGGFVEDILRKGEDGKVNGHYIKLHYVMSDGSGSNKTTLAKIHSVDGPHRGDSTLWLNQTVENRETNTYDKNVNTYESKDKLNTFEAPAKAGTPSKGNKLEQRDTHNIKSGESAISTLNPTLLKEGGLEPYIASKPIVQKNLTKSLEGSKPLKTISKECRHGSSFDMCSKCGRHPCTEEELWEIAGKTNVDLSFVEDKHQQILDMIEGGEFDKKYKTVFSTLRNWIRMAKEKGYAPIMEGVEKEIFIKNSPEILQKKKLLLRAAFEKGIL